MAAHIQSHATHMFSSYAFKFLSFHFFAGIVTVGRRKYVVRVGTPFLVEMNWNDLQNVRTRKKQVLHKTRRLDEITDDNDDEDSCAGMCRTHAKSEVVSSFSLFSSAHLLTWAEKFIWRNV